MHITLKKLRRGPALKLLFSIVATDTDSSVIEAISDEINVDDSAFIKFKFNLSNDNMTLRSSFTMKSISTNPLIKMKMRVMSNDFDKEIDCPDNYGSYRTINSKRNDVYFYAENRAVYACVIVVTVQVRVISVATNTASLSQFNSLRDNPDFCLKTADGSGAVFVHRSILIPHSEIFQAILSDNSSETEWHFTNPNVTVETLQHLKKYIYFNTLPDRGLPELLLAATNCFMERLKTDCIVKIAEGVSAEELDDVIDFAIKNNIPELVRAMVIRTPDSVVNRAYELKEKIREIS